MSVAPPCSNGEAELGSTVIGAYASLMLVLCDGKQRTMALQLLVATQDMRGESDPLLHSQYIPTRRFLPTLSYVEPISTAPILPAKKLLTGKLPGSHHPYPIWRGFIYHALGDCDRRWARSFLLICSRFFFTYPSKYHEHINKPSRQAKGNAY